MTKDSQRIIIIDTPEELDGGNVGYIEALFKGISRLRGKPLRELMGKFALCTSCEGRPGVPLYADPQYREYARKVMKAFPWLFYFASIESDALLFFALASLKNFQLIHRGNARKNRIIYDSRELYRFVNRQCLRMKEVFRRAGLSERAYFKRVEQIRQYYLQIETKTGNLNKSKRRQ